jgi:hypothetical protein
MKIESFAGGLLLFAVQFPFWAKPALGAPDPMAQNLVAQAAPSSSETPAEKSQAPSSSPETSGTPTTVDFDRKSVGIINQCFHHRGDSWFANSRFNEYRDVTEMKGVTVTADIKPIGEADRLNGVDWNADYYIQCKVLRQAFRQIPGPLVKWSDWQDEESQKTPIFRFRFTRKNGRWSVLPQMRNMFGEYDDYNGLIPAGAEALPEYGVEGERKLEALIANSKSSTHKILDLPFVTFYCDGKSFKTGRVTLTDTALSFSIDQSTEAESGTVSVWLAQIWSVERQQVARYNGPEAAFVASDIGASGGGNYDLGFATDRDRDRFCEQLNAAVLEWKKKYPNVRQNRYFGLKINN